MLERKEWGSEFEDLVNRAFADFPFAFDFPTARAAPFATPALDVYEKDGKYLLDVAVPGYEPKDLSVEVHGSTVTVSGAHRESDEKKTARYYRREVRSGSFSRTVTLPAEVDANSVDAQIKKGVLTVTLTPTKPIAAKKIAIKGE